MASRAVPAAPARSTARHRTTARRVMAWSHRWAGAVAALWLGWVALTGAALAFSSGIFRLQYGAMLDGGPAGETGAAVDRIAAAARAAAPEAEPAGIYMPGARLEIDAALYWGMDPAKPGLDAVQMVAVDAGTGEANGRFALADAWGHDLIDWHYQLFAGEAGGTISAVLGLLVLLFGLSGLYLWWPRGRVSFWAKLRSFDWHGTSLRKMFRLHGQAGLWLLPPILFFSVTGSALAKPDWFGRTLGGLPREVPAALAPGFAARCEAPVSPGDAARTAEAANPGRRVASLEWGEHGAPYRIGLKAPGDWSVVEGDAVSFVHATCPGVQWSARAADADVPGKVGNAMFGLHSGRALGIAGTLLVLLAGIGLAGLCGSGLYVWAARLGGKDKVRRPAA